MSQRGAEPADSSGSDTFVLKDLAALKAMADPLRLQIVLELSEKARTVKEVAARIDVPPTRLYYHFKILERAKMIRVVETRLVSGIEERRYQAVATSWSPEADSVHAMVKEGVIAAMLNVVRAELELALMTQSGRAIGVVDAPVPILTLTRWHLSIAEAEEVQRRLRALMDEFGSTEPAPDKRAYHALLAWYQAPDELRNQQKRDEATDAP